MVCLPTCFVTSLLMTSLMTSQGVTVPANVKRQIENTRREFFFVLHPTSNACLSLVTEHQLTIGACSASCCSVIFMITTQSWSSVAIRAPQEWYRLAYCTPLRETDREMRVTSGDACADDVPCNHGGANVATVNNTCAVPSVVARIRHAIFR